MISRYEVKFNWVFDTKYIPGVNNIVHMNGINK